MRFFFSLHTCICSDIVQMKLDYSEFSNNTYNMLFDTFGIKTLISYLLLTR